MLFAFGIAYMILMVFLDQDQDGANWIEIWFRTALPVSWMFSLLTLWLLHSYPRPGFGILIKRLKAQFVARPGRSVFWAGMAPLVMGIAAVFGTTNRDLAMLVYEWCAMVVIAAALIAGMVGWMWRRKAR